MRDDEVPAEVQERLERIGTAIRALIRDEEDPAVVCAIMSANLDTWAEEHGYSAKSLVTSIAVAVIHNAEG